MQNKINKVVWFIIIILVLGLLLFLNSKRIDDSLNLNPNQEEINEGEVDKNESENKEDESSKTESGNKKLECENKGGEWFSGSNVCEINSLSQEQCLAQGGEFNECASACRHDPEAEMCTMQCVLTCTFK